MPQVVSFPGPLADAGEHRHSLVHRSDVADELLNNYCLAHARAPISPNLASLHERSDQVEHLDPGFQNLDAGVLVVETGWVAVDGPALGHFHLPQVVQRGAGHVE